MTPLRRRMIEDMQIRNLAPRTQISYVEQVDRFARHFRKSPERLGPPEIRAWQIYLAQDKRLAAGSISVAVAALRFLYTVALRQAWTIKDDIPTCRQTHPLPEVLSTKEVATFLDAVKTLKQRVILTVCYAAGVTCFRGGPVEANRDRQSAHGHSCGRRQRAERSLRDALATAAGHSARLLESHPPKRVAVSRRPSWGADHKVRCRERLSGSP
jgi:hypothetical protein